MVSLSLVRESVNKYVSLVLPWKVIPRGKQGREGAANDSFLLVSASGSSGKLAACLLALHYGKYVHPPEKPKLGKVELHYGVGP